jgi:hypothetical protein
VKLKIVSDGTPQGTRVVTPSGEMINNVEAAEISIDAKEGVKAKLRFKSIEVELVAELPWGYRA